MTRLAACLVAFSFLPLPAALRAQTARAIEPPTLPLMTVYHYWPVQFVQFVGEELPYSRVILEVDPAGKQPLLQVTLTERASGKQIHYTESDALLAAARASGEEAYKTAIAYEPAETENPGSMTTVRFTMADGKPLQFRFVQGSDISQQGSGLNPFPGAKFPIFAYREQGAVAGEGTALQIGNIVSNASVWKEISRPPYFIGYHGAETVSAHTLIFVPGSETWTVKASPAALAAGSTWELDSDKGNHRSVKIEKVDGPHITVVETDLSQPGVRCSLDATKTEGGWHIERARFAPNHDGDKHVLTLQFADAMPATLGDGSFTLIAGRKTTLATATLRGTSADGKLTVTFASPAWLGGMSMLQTVKKDPQGFAISAAVSRP